MTRPGYVDRSKLQNWADTRSSQSEFPRLVRRLVLETTPGLVELGMPAGEGVAAGDWDGSIRTTEATAWVPEGLSVWELSVNSSPNKKADEDYVKRADTPDGTSTGDCTYVEAILRPWTARASWATGKRDGKVWRDVKALGLDDIETWLEAAPITWAWLSEELGLSPYGLRTGLTWWRDWAAQTNPALTPEVVLAGRADAVQDFEDRLASSGSITTVAGASMEEVCAFVAAVAVNRDEEGKGKMLARLAFVDDISAWRQLTASSQPLVLVPRTPELASEIPTGTIHSYCVPVLAEEGADVILPSLDASELVAALRAGGIADSDKADALGRLGRRSLTALRRNIAVKAALHRPRWADTAPPRNVRSILLAGSWGDNAAGDRSIIEALAGGDYETFRESITGIVDHDADPLAIRTDGAWHLVSAVDAWMLLVSKLTYDDMQRFETVVEMVLAEGDPALDLPRDQRWRASIDGRTRRYTGDLRRGLAQSLALLGVYGGTVTWSGGASGSVLANYLVRKLLEWASADSTGQAWQSLGDILPLLAEAAPEAFLDAVSAAAAGDEPPVLATMFQDSADESDLFSGGTPHTYLLWALECLSWCPDYFGRAVALLARLDEIDPGGRMSNRPAASLAAIYRPWHPDSSVDPDRRLAVLDTLRRRHPGAAWKLECSMLPETHGGTHFPISAPTFRTWKPDQQSVTYGEIWKMTTAAVERCIEDADRDAEQWATILDHTSAMPPADRELVVAALHALADQPGVSFDFRDSVWRKLVDVIGPHREFADATWSLPDDELAKLDGLASRYQPVSAYLRLAGLFQSYRPYIGARRLGDYEGFERELGRQRVEAIKEIEAEGGFDAIMKLARDATVYGAVGIALANAGSSHDAELLAWLAIEGSDDLAGTAMSYFSARYALEGFDLITSLLAQDDLTIEQRARLLLVARDNLPEVWALAAADQELDTRYWTAFQPLGLGHDFDKLDEVADRLILAGRHADVLRLMSMYSHTEDGPRPERARLIVRALDGLLANQDQSATARGLQTYDFQHLFAYLEAMRDHLEPDDLVRLQWAYLPALGYDAKIPALSESLAHDPLEFVGMVCLVFRARPESEDEEETEGQADDEQRDASMATNAYRLLNAWDSPPGLVDGAMDAGVLRAWFDRAVELLAERGRTEVGLQQFGQVLGHTPPDPDGTWPGVVVQDLLEDVQLEHIETGLYLHIVNGRGITSRGLEDGGDQELKLVADYRAKAEVLADSAPRMAALFRRLAGSYENDARRNEGDAERFRRGLN